MQLFRLSKQIVAFIILVISLNAHASKKRPALKPEPEQEQEESQDKEIGVAMNFADMANFSHYVNRRRLRTVASLKEVNDENGNASNFRVVGQHYGHHMSVKSFRSKGLNKTRFNNFSMEVINSHSIEAKKAHWSNFYISGTISDWNFQYATLENGWFNAVMKNCDFRGAYLKNVGFYGAKLTSTHNPLKYGKVINFDGAILENVTFKGSALKRASFKDTVFRSNIKFQNANVRFVTQFAGAKFVDDSGKEHVITKDQADKLDKKFETEGGEKDITSDQIVKIMEP